MSKNPRDRNYHESWLSLLGVEMWLAIVLAVIVPAVVFFLFPPLLTSLFGTDEQLSTLFLQGDSKLAVQCSVAFEGKHYDDNQKLPAHDVIADAASDDFSSTCTNDGATGSFTMTLTCPGGDRSATTSDPYGSVSVSCSP